MTYGFQYTHEKTYPYVNRIADFSAVRSWNTDGTIMDMMTLSGSATYTVKTDLKTGYGTPILPMEFVLRSAGEGEYAFCDAHDVILRCEESDLPRAVSEYLEAGKSYMPP